MILDYDLLSLNCQISIMIYIVDIFFLIYIFFNHFFFKKKKNFAKIQFL